MTEPNNDQESPYLWGALSGLCLGLSLLIIKVRLDSVSPDWQLPEQTNFGASTWSQIDQLKDSATLLKMAHVWFDPGSTYLLVPLFLCLLVCYFAVQNPERGILRFLVSLMKHFAIVYLAIFGLGFALSAHNATAFAAMAEGCTGMVLCGMFPTYALLCAAIAQSVRAHEQNDPCPANGTIARLPADSAVKRSEAPPTSKQLSAGEATVSDGEYIQLPAEEKEKQQMRARQGD